MGEMEKLSAKPIKLILDERTRTPVGALYLWNDGTTGTRWFDGPVERVVYEDLRQCQKQS